MFRSSIARLTLGLLAVLLLAALAPAAGASPPTAPAGIDTWTGEYFNNTSLSGAPALVRNDASIDFFWPEGTSPAPGAVGVDHYSARWTRSLYFNTAGNWTFHTANDDGMRVWVDNVIAVDAWYDQGPTSHTGIMALNAGWHTVRVEYYNNVLGGTARFAYTLGSTASAWRGEYYNNQDLSGDPTLIRDDPSINFDWGTSRPDSSIPADHFSVRWTRTLYFDVGTWRFTTTADDGVRLWVDGNLLIDKWFDQSVASYSRDWPLAAGNHAVKMEYYEKHVNGVARLSYARASETPATTWLGQYFDNVSFDGSPVLVRYDPAVNFNWGTNSPGEGVPANYFAAKWDSVQSVPRTGNYTVSATADDGIRVWVDGGLAIDAWYDHPATTFTAARYLTAGPHTVHVEYYERTVNASVNVQILPGDAPPAPAPAPSLGSEVTVDDAGTGWMAGGPAGGWKAIATGTGGHAFWAYTHSSAPSSYNWAQWFPALTQAGNYEVLVYIPGGVATTGQARYWVYHNNLYDLAVRSQMSSPDRWISLGTYYFRAGGGENVSLADVTYECDQCRTVVFDAVKFSPR